MQSNYGYHCKLINSVCLNESNLVNLDLYVSTRIQLAISCERDLISVDNVTRLLDVILLRRALAFRHLGTLFKTVAPHFALDLLHIKWINESVIVEFVSSSCNPAVQIVTFVYWCFLTFMPLYLFRISGDIYIWLRNGRKTFLGSLITTKIMYFC